MLKNWWRIMMLGLILTSMVMITGCGGTGGGGTGVDSSGASLALAVDKTTAAAGTDSVAATVTLTSLNSQPVNGVSVSVEMSYNGSVIGSASANTNTNGIATIVLPVGLVTSDRTVYLQAKSSGITSSSSVAVAVAAPVLATTIPTTLTKSAVAGSTIEYVLQGDTVTFKNGNGTAIAGVPITFTLTSQTGDPTSILLHNSAPISPASGTFTTTATDGSGTATTGLTAILSAPVATDSSSVTTFYYTISATYNGLTFTRQLSTQFTLTATAASAMTLTPATVAFLVGDPLSAAQIVTISGGTAPYSVLSDTPLDISASVIGGTVTVTKLTAAGTTAKTAEVHVSDSLGATVIVPVTYFK